VGLLAGGHAALWTGIAGPPYAPDLEILGVAAIAPAANVKSILALNVAVDKRFGPYIALAYSRFYPDITFEQALRPEALVAARQIVNLCDFLPPEDPERIEALVETFDGPALATSSNKALQARLEQMKNTLPNTSTKIFKSIGRSNIYPRLRMALCLVLCTFGLGLSVNAGEKKTIITTFDAPGAGTSAGQGTFANGMNDSGAITGFIRDANAARHGYLRAPDGTFTIFDDPAAGTCFNILWNHRERPGYACLRHQPIWGDRGILYRQ
jgi:hypothetical protein